MLAKIHRDDAQPDSAAVLKLLALLPAALPARVESAEWIVELAIKSEADEFGNVLLSDRAYLPASYYSNQDRVEDGEARTDVAGIYQVKKEDKEEGEEGGKVTRSMRQKSGQEVPSIPLPEFWRKRNQSGALSTGTVAKEEETPVKVKVEDNGEVGRMGLEMHRLVSPAEAEVDALTAVASSSQRSRHQIPLQATKRSLRSRQSLTREKYRELAQRQSR